MRDARARALRERAEQVLPGGVDSPVRAYRAVPGVPPHIVGGAGAHVTDADGNDYVDYVLAYGPHILGHQPPQVLAALRAQLERGIAYGHTVELEVELAERIIAAVPSVEMVRFVTSGTEAAMSAVRLARAATGRERIVKFAGAYHGHADALLAEAGSGVATLGIPGSPGVPAAAVADTVVLPFNDPDAVAALFEQGGDRVAAVIVEPVAGNMGCVPPLPGFLDHLRAVTSKCGALLVFDEVMTGFRVAYGGAQALYGVTPDLSLFGKVIGGGLPVGAYGGRRDLMAQVAPAGPVYQAGTLAGSPLAMAAGCAVLDVLRDDPSLYDDARAARGPFGNRAAASGRCRRYDVHRWARRQHDHTLSGDRTGRPRSMRSGMPTASGLARCTRRGWLPACSGHPRSSRPGSSRPHTPTTTSTRRWRHSRTRCPGARTDLRGASKTSVRLEAGMLSGLGGHLPEIIIVLVVILIIWGPGKLPDVGAALGRGIREFRKASSDVHDSVVNATTTPAEPTPAAQVTPAVAAPAAQAVEPVSAQADAPAPQPTVSA